MLFWFRFGRVKEPGAPGALGQEEACQHHPGKSQHCCFCIFLIRITPGGFCLLLLKFLPLFLYLLHLSQISASLQCFEWTALKRFYGMGRRAFLGHLSHFLQLWISGNCGNSKHWIFIISVWRWARHASVLLKKFSERRKVLHESFLAEGLNLDGVVRLLSPRFMGIHLRWRWIQEFSLEMLPRGDLQQHAYAKWTYTCSQRWSLGD